MKNYMLKLIFTIFSCILLTSEHSSGQIKEEIGVDLSKKDPLTAYDFLGEINDKIYLIQQAPISSLGSSSISRLIYMDKSASEFSIPIRIKLFYNGRIVNSILNAIVFQKEIVVFACIKTGGKLEVLYGSGLPNASEFVVEMKPLFHVDSKIYVTDYESFDYSYDGDSSKLYALIAFNGKKGGKRAHYIILDENKTVQQNKEIVATGEISTLKPMELRTSGFKVTPNGDAFIWNVVTNNGNIRSIVHHLMYFNESSEDPTYNKQIFNAHDLDNASLLGYDTSKKEAHFIFSFKEKGKARDLISNSVNTPNIVTFVWKYAQNTVSTPQIYLIDTMKLDSYTILFEPAKEIKNGQLNYLANSKYYAEEYDSHRQTYRSVSRLGVSLLLKYADGKILSIKPIRKGYTPTSYLYDDYFMTEINEYTYIFYNAKEKRPDIPRVTVASDKYMGTFVTIISPDGKSNVVPLLTMNNPNDLAIAPNHVYVSNNRVYFYSRMLKKQAIVKFTIGEDTINEQF